MTEEQTDKSPLENKSGNCIGKATGPRSLQGKQRSKSNALKNGIFAKAILLEGESRAEYELLLNGLREDLQPRGMLEAVIVEEIAVIVWQKRRFRQAERAEIAKAVEFEPVDFALAQVSERWDLMRAGGGILKNVSNSLLIREAIGELKVCRARLEKWGFQRDRDQLCLTKLYGLDSNSCAPAGIFEAYQILWKLATDATKQQNTASQNTPSPDERKKEMVSFLDSEIERLESLVAMLRVIDSRRSEYQRTAALVPAQGVVDRLLRYESHLNREFDRKLSQLERLQRARLGKPEPPRLVVDINAQ